MFYYETLIRLNHWGKSTYHIPQQDTEAEGNMSGSCVLCLVQPLTGTVQWAASETGEC